LFGRGDEGVKEGRREKGVGRGWLGQGLRLEGAMVVEVEAEAVAAEDVWKSCFWYDLLS